MADDPRQRMIESAIRLLATRGLQGTSFTEVLEDSGAPRGSLYHHFSGGKDEMVTAAIEQVATRALDMLEKHAGESAHEIAALFLGMWRELLTRSHLRAGCSVLAVAVAADSLELFNAAGNVFRRWRVRLGALLRQGGLAQRDAARMSATLIAASEGAVVLARAEKSIEPFEEVAAQLLADVDRASKRRR